MPTSAPRRAHTLAVKAALAALRIYKAYVSPWFAGSCRFEPTCSQYAYQAIERFGVLRGVWLGLQRLARCQPLAKKFGYDPVPEVAESDGDHLSHVAKHKAGHNHTTPKEAHS